MVHMRGWDINNVSSILGFVFECVVLCHISSNSNCEIKFYLLTYLLTYSMVQDII